MDTTTIITWVAGGLVTGLVYYLFNRIGKAEDKHDSLDSDFRKHLAELPLHYVAKDDHRSSLQEIKDILREMREEMRERKTRSSARRALAD